jgi:hypothetical protein
MDLSHRLKRLERALGADKRGCYACRGQSDGVVLADGSEMTEDVAKAHVPRCLACDRELVQLVYLIEEIVAPH